MYTFNTFCSQLTNRSITFEVLLTRIILFLITTFDDTIIIINSYKGSISNLKGVRYFLHYLHNIEKFDCIQSYCIEAVQKIIKY